MLDWRSAITLALLIGAIFTAVIVADHPFAF